MADSDKKIRILIVDDHEVVRVGLRGLLERNQEFTVVGEASSADEAVEKALAEPVDVVVMDVRMPNGSGIEACRAIRQARPETKVIMLTSYADDEAVFASVMAGASGYVLKQIGSQELVDAIRTVARGASLLDPTVTGQLLNRMRNLSTRGPEGVDELTEHERNILALIAEGKTNKEIAGELYLSEKTVRNYVSSLLSKLGLSNRTEAAAYAVRRQLLGEIPRRPQRH